MSPVGPPGRSRLRPRCRRALLAAALVLAAACSSGGQDVAAPTTTTTATSLTVDGDEAAATTTTAADPSPSDPTTTTSASTGGPRTTATAAPAPSTTRATTTSAPTSTTRKPPTTAATTTTTTTTTAPPPTTTTTAPPPTTTTTTTAPASSDPKHGTRNTGCEQYMFNQINGARANAGAPAVQFDTGIHHVAIGWSDEMARTQTLKHNPNYADQIAEVRNYRYAAENVGRGYQNDTLFQAFMDSPGHRKNIENPVYSHVTVGCLNDSSGQLWVTQNFWGS